MLIVAHKWRGLQVGSWRGSQEQVTVTILVQTRLPRHPQTRRHIQLQHQLWVTRTHANKIQPLTQTLTPTTIKKKKNVRITDLCLAHACEKPTLVTNHEGSIQLALTFSPFKKKAWKSAGFPKLRRDRTRRHHSSNAPKPSPR